MPSEPHDTEAVIAAANAPEPRPWQVWLYTGNSRCLLLRTGQHYLVVSEPSYVRLPVHPRVTGLRLFSPDDGDLLRVPVGTELDGRIVVGPLQEDAGFRVVGRKIRLLRRGEAGLVSRQFAAGAQLAGANLGGRSLRWEDLRGADLRGADLRGTDLLHTRFDGADLTGADLSGASARNARFDGARLEHARLCGTDLRGVDLDEAVLRSADLSQANLEWVRLNELDLYRALLCGANLEHARFDGSDLREADLRGANLAWAWLDADLRGADLRGADLSGVRLACGRRTADLRGADLRGARLCGADLCGAQLEGADLTGIETDEWTRWTEEAPHPPFYFDSDRIPTLEEKRARLDALRGGTLKWRVYHVTHGWTAFDVEMPGAAPQTLSFSHTHFAEFPDTLTNVRLRILQGEEHETVLEAYPDCPRFRSEHFHLFQIASDQGSFHFYAGSAHNPFLAAPDPHDMDYFNAPLWIGGPTPVEVGTGFHRTDAANAEPKRRGKTR